MFNLENAKNAVDGLKKGEKLGEAAKSVLKGVDLEKAPEQVIAALRKLLAEAKQRAAGSKNEALDACIEKAQALLDSDNITTEAVTKLTAELTALLKGAPAAGPAPQAAKPAPAQAAKPAAAPATKPTPAPAAKAAPAPTPKPEAPAAKPVQFSDVDANAYYYDAVQWAVQKGITSGTSETTFSPDQECTCGQTIVLLWRAAGSPAPKGGNNPFTDVKEDAYYYQSALWAAERGIVTGTALHADEPVTRGQFALFLYRNAGSPAVAGKNDFTDVPDSAPYAQAVTWVAAQGIASGTGEHTFSPDGVCTRGQIVTFLYRAKK